MCAFPLNLAYTCLASFVRGSHGASVIFIFPPNCHTLSHAGDVPRSPDETVTYLPLRYNDSLEPQLLSPSETLPPIRRRWPCFDREPSKKSIELEVCLSVWDLVLAGPEFPLVKSFSEFLRSSKVPVVTKDMWAQTLAFLCQVDADLSNFDETGELCLFCWWVKIPCFAWWVGSDMWYKCA